MHGKHRDTFLEPRHASSTGLFVRPARRLTLATMFVAAIMVTGLPQVSSAAPAHPVTSHIRQVGFVDASVAELRSSRSATGSVRRTPGVPDPINTARAAAVTPAQHVAGAVTVVGVTWPKGATSAKDTYQIRTLTGACGRHWMPPRATVRTRPRQPQRPRGPVLMSSRALRSTRYAR
jgi:hypothetical protein